jgi:nicotinamidase-related amidase
VPKTALIVVDMLQTYDFDEGDRLAENVERVIEPLRSLLDRAEDRDDLWTMYVNDAIGPWTSDRNRVIEQALEGRHPHLVEPILPPDDATFVVKARHSIFYGTPLDYILGQESVERIVLTGQVTEQCILYSALDAHIRHIPISVPHDAVAHIHEDMARAALRMMERNLGAEIVSVHDVVA